MRCFKCPSITTEITSELFGHFVLVIATAAELVKGRTKEKNTSAKPTSISKMPCTAIRTGL